ncbi:MAG: hypothetical protein JWN78_2543 [Bacteroidota bacterium]|nr:hypothetical protein [Bacteroidota bacterium]
MKNNLHKKILFPFIILFLTLQVSAQDYKFSQFYNSPLNLNPAFTGKINSLYRFVANYRIQYLPLQSSPTPYNTLSASADFGLLRDQLRGDIFGVGILFTNDRQTAIRSNTAMASVAYHKSLGKDKNHFLSVGVQVGFTERSLDYGSLAFASQFDSVNSTFNLHKPSGEAFSSGTYFKPNLNIGLFWSSNFNKMLSAYAGFSMFNVLKPKDTFFKSDNERAYRLNAHAGVMIDINRIVLISPNGMFMTQAKAMQWIAGTSASFNLSGKKEPYKTAVSVGVWYDGNGAVIASAGVSFSGVQIGLSYDATFKKDLSKAVKTFGALEASIIYTGKPLDKKKQYSPLLCPKF